MGSINESETSTQYHTRKLATEIALHGSIDRLILDGDTFRSRPSNKFAETVRFRTFCIYENVTGTFLSRDLSYGY